MTIWEKKRSKAKNWCAFSKWFYRCYCCILSVLNSCHWSIGSELQITSYFISSIRNISHSWIYAFLGLTHPWSTRKLWKSCVVWKPNSKFILIAWNRKRFCKPSSSKCFSVSFHLSKVLNERKIEMKMSKDNEIYVPNQRLMCNACVCFKLLNVFYKHKCGECGLFWCSFQMRTLSTDVLEEMNEINATA